MDDKGAISEIRGLSDNARRHLQHTLRNSLQSMLANIEEGGSKDELEGCVLMLAQELGRLGL